MDVTCVNAARWLQWQPYSHVAAFPNCRLSWLTVAYSDMERSNYFSGHPAALQLPHVNNSMATIHGHFRTKSSPGRHDSSMLTALMLHFAERGEPFCCQTLWSELISSSIVPDPDIVSQLMDASVEAECFDDILQIASEMALRYPDSGCKGYSLAVSCFGKHGKLDMMEIAVKEMVSKGFKIDSKTGNTFVRYYGKFGSIPQMEAAYQRLKKSGILVETDAIHAMALNYIKKRKYFRLGEFVKDVGLARRNLGSLLWNLLLLSYAVNFKMKTLQREFLNMLDAGFYPDLTTLNIRALAFSRMCMFWDLHLSLEHMKRDGVTPDLVTYGCFVDAYLERRLARNLPFVLDKMNTGSEAVVATNPLVFEALGKGGFHASSEDLMLATENRRWTYSMLVNVYLKKSYRKNQIFWNY